MDLNEVPMLVKNEHVQHVDFYYSPLRERLQASILDSVQNEHIDLVFSTGADSCLQILFLYFSQCNKKFHVPQFSYPGFTHILDQLNIHYTLYDQHAFSDYALGMSDDESDQSVILLCRPNNPDGSIVKIDKRVLTDYKGILIVDECYYEFLTEGDFQFDRTIKSESRVFLIRTFSKSFGSPGLRLGYILSSKVNIQNLNKFILPYTVSNLVYEKAISLWSSRELMFENIKLLSLLTNDLIHSIKNLGYQVINTSTYFFIFRDIDNRRTQDLHRLLKQKYTRLLLLKDVNQIHWIRLSCSHSRDNKQFLDLLVKYKNEL